MKIIPSIITLIIGAGVGSGATYLLMPKSSNFTETATQPIATASGTDDYEIRWYGQPKKQYWRGAYTIMKPNSPIEVFEIPKSPHIVKIKLPKQSVVSAVGDVQDIKIFRNGKECGSTGIVGKGFPLNKGCQPDL